MPLSAAESPRGVLGRARPFAKRPPGSNSYGKVVLNHYFFKKSFRLRNFLRFNPKLHSENSKKSRGGFAAALFHSVSNELRRLDGREHWDGQTPEYD